MEALYETACENLKNYERITANILCKEIQQIFSSMGDGHTCILANFQDFHYLKHKYNHDTAGNELVRINKRIMNLYAMKSFQNVTLRYLRCTVVITMTNTKSALSPCSQR